MPPDAKSVSPFGRLRIGRRVTVQAGNLDFRFDQKEAMQMRQPPNRQMGASGETAVKGFFENLGWGAIGTGDHDLGTDLYLQLRDDEGVELLLMMGVQVKTGTTSLSEQATVNGEDGWWFREDDHSHLDYWSDHPVPHILVLQDETKTRRFWAYLDRETIRSTGKGMRVFVPASQPLDGSFREPWAQTADRALRRLQFEGSRWNYDATIRPVEDQARMALLTPRLVVPHPNRGSATPMTWSQAAATVIDSSATRWEENAERHEAVPDFGEALRHEDPHWRFAGALYAWRTGADADPLEAVAASTRSSRMGVATAVALSVALHQSGQFERAVEALRVNLVHDEHTVDQGWLRVRIASLEMERGENHRARSMAGEATVRLARQARDVTASALQSTATWILFETEETLVRDLSDVLPALDNMASWWRSEKVANGLSTSTAQAARSWARDPAVLIGGASTGRNHLASAELIANLTGMTSQASHARGLRAKVDLTEGRDATGALHGLLSAGDHSSLKAALRHLRSVGSAGTLSEFISGVDPESFSRTTFRAGLTAVAEAGDYATHSHGAHLAAAVADMLLGRDDRPTRLRPMSLTTGPLLEALAGVVVFAEETVTRDVVDHLLDAEHDETHKGPLSRLLGRLDDAGHLRAFSARVAEAAQDDSAPRWRTRVFATRAFEVHEVRVATRGRILGGDLEALRGVPDLAHLRGDEVAAALQACWANLRVVTDSARRGSMSVMSTDAARLAAGLLLTHRRPDEWAPLLRFLEDGAVALNLKIDTCRFLAAHTAAVPLSTRRALEEALPAIRQSKAMPDPSGRRLETAALDALQVQLGGDDEIASPMLAALATSAAEEHRTWYAGRLRASGNVDALAVLLVDPSPRVRAAVMSALASIAVDDGAASRQALRTLEAGAAHAGEQSLAALMHELPRSVRLERPQLVPLLENLRRHPAWRIRQSASVLLNDGIHEHDGKSRKRE